MGFFGFGRRSSGEGNPTSVSEAVPVDVNETAQAWEQMAQAARNEQQAGMAGVPMGESVVEAVEMPVAGGQEMAMGVAETAEEEMSPEQKAFGEQAMAFLRGRFPKMTEALQEIRASYAAKAAMGRMEAQRVQDQREMERMGTQPAEDYEDQLVGKAGLELGRMLEKIYGTKARPLAGEDGSVTESEDAVWSLAAEPREPGTLDMVDLFMNNPQHEDETMDDYKQRIHNYRKHDLTRDKQLEADAKYVTEHPDSRMEDFHELGGAVAIASPDLKKTIDLHKKMNRIENELEQRRQVVMDEVETQRDEWQQRLDNFEQAKGQLTNEQVEQMGGLQEAMLKRMVERADQRVEQARHEMWHGEESASAKTEQADEGTKAEQKAGGTWGVEDWEKNLATIDNLRKIVERRLSKGGMDSKTEQEFEERLAKLDENARKAEAKIKELKAEAEGAEKGEANGETEPNEVSLKQLESLYNVVEQRASTCQDEKLRQRFVKQMGELAAKIEQMKESGATSAQLSPAGV